MVAIGNFFFKTRNYLFPIFYVFLFLPFPRITDHYLKVFIPGLCIAFLGQLVRMVTIGMEYIIRGGKNRRIYAEGLVTEGMFSHCRNPMYVGNITLVVGMSLISNSIMAVMFMIPFFIFIYQAIVKAEEDFLRDEFGEGFDTYCENVNRWLPNLKGVSTTFKNSDFSIKKVLYKEYGTTFLWTLGATLLFAYNRCWFSNDFSYERHLIGPSIALGVLLTFYLTTRYLKKSEKRRTKFLNS